MGENGAEICQNGKTGHLLSTRFGKQYRKEMSEKDHMALLEVLKESRAKVILSGYENELYNKILEGWHKEEIVSMTQNQKMAREVLWMNFQPERQMKLY